MVRMIGPSNESNAKLVVEFDPGDRVLRCMFSEPCEGLEMTLTEFAEFIEQMKELYIKVNKDG